MALHALQRRDWHGTLHELGDLFVLLTDWRRWRRGVAV